MNGCHGHCDGFSEEIIFLRKKEKVNNDLRNVIEKRVHVEGMCSKALNRLVNFVFRTMIILGLGSFFYVLRHIIEEIEKQNAKINQQHDTIRTQNSMLEQIMGAFRVTLPGVSGVSGVPDGGEGSIPPSESEGTDILDNNLHPPSRLDTPVTCPWDRQHSMN